jgi:hypothetical protein
MSTWTGRLHILLQCVSEFIIRSGQPIILYEVLNPVIHMSWIQNHWEKKFVDDAETKLKQLVCLYFYIFLSNVLNLYGLQDD